MQTLNENQLELINGGGFVWETSRTGDGLAMEGVEVGNLRGLPANL